MTKTPPSKKPDPVVTIATAPPAPQSGDPKFALGTTTGSVIREDGTAPAPLPPQPEEAIVPVGTSNWKMPSAAPVPALFLHALRNGPWSHEEMAVAGELVGLADAYVEPHAWCEDVKAALGIDTNGLNSFSDWLQAKVKAIMTDPTLTTPRVAEKKLDFLKAAVAAAVAATLKHRVP